MYRNSLWGTTFPTYLVYLTFGTFGRDNVESKLTMLYLNRGSIYMCMQLTAMFCVYCSVECDVPSGKL